jgi:phage terminase small subunit
MKTNNEQLSLQQQRFCDEYLVNFNAFKSALNAGYSENTARKCELLHLPKVQAYLQDAMQRTSERLEITHDMILRELAKVAFANMGDYYDENAVLKPMNQLTGDQKAAISHYQLIDCVGEYGERAGELSKIKLHNKMAALDKIAKHTGFYLMGKKKADVGGLRSEIGSQMAEVEGQMDEGGSQMSESREVEVLSGELSVVNGDDLMEDVRGKTEDVVSGNILTLSPPCLMEDARCKTEDVTNENILVLSPGEKQSKVGSQGSGQRIIRNWHTRLC